MKYYPVNLNVRDRCCLVVGAGAVGARKAAVLLSCGAKVRVVSPEISDAVSHMVLENRIFLERRSYQEADIYDVFLVFAATDNTELNQRIYEDARRHGKLCNIADHPELCDFTLPAVIERGDLMIAVSTSGKSPAYARWIRQRLETQFGPEHAELLQLLGGIRRQIQQRAGDSEGQRRIFEYLMEHGLLEHVKNKDRQQIDELLASVLGVLVKSQISD